MKSDIQFDTDIIPHLHSYMQDGKRITETIFKPKAKQAEAVKPPTDEPLKTKAVRLENVPKLHPLSRVNVTVCGEVVAEMTFLKSTPAQGIKKLSKTHYEVIKTGEIKEFEVKEKKQATNLVKTFTKLRQMINTNFEVNDSELFITCTYKENMQDTERLYTDFEKFNKRLNYFVKRELVYIVVMEPQGRGAWHIHMLVKAVDGGCLYIDNREMEKLWGFGWTETKRLKGDNPGAYFSAYFTNTPEENEEHGGLIADPKKAKKYKKGGRLEYYPKDFKFFRCSRNAKKPVIEKDVQYGTLVHVYGQPLFETAFELVQVNMQGEQVGDAKNLIVKQNFNKKRSGKM